MKYLVLILPLLILASCGQPDIPEDIITQPPADKTRPPTPDELEKREGQKIKIGSSDTSDLTPASEIIGNLTVRKLQPQSHFHGGRLKKVHSGSPLAWEISVKTKIEGPARVVLETIFFSGRDAEGELVEENRHLIKLEIPRVGVRDKIPGAKGGSVGRKTARAVLFTLDEAGETVILHQSEDFEVDVIEHEGVVGQ